MFSENYVHNVYTSEHTNGSYFASGLCHRSQRKNEPPHKMRITEESEQGIGEAGNLFCSSRAG